ncbi:MAG: PqqD family protein [Sphingobacteriia bacterium]|nr:PqqD family protein [Sphingobacteriia bacterium]
MITLSEQTVIQRNDTRFLCSALGDEMVMMDMENGDYIGINNVGTDIWSILEKPASIKDIVNHLLTGYDVSEEQCTKEVHAFLIKMHEQNLLIINSTE